MKLPLRFVAVLALAGMPVCANGATTLTIDPSAAWNGFMNVFETAANGGGFIFGSGWGTADLQANFTGDILTLAPNTIGDPDPFWYVGGGGPGSPGNKIMDASMYLQPDDGTLSGQTIIFTGEVLSNTLTSAHTAVAFIKDFAPDYSSFNVITAPLIDGVFSISLDTEADPTRHIQYGFQTIGENVWVTDVAPFGEVNVTAVPEPTGAILGQWG